LAQQSCFSRANLLAQHRLVCKFSGPTELILLRRACCHDTGSRRSRRREGKRRRLHEGGRAPGLASAPTHLAPAAEEGPCALLTHHDHGDAGKTTDHGLVRLAGG
jgi:hypothetical protein